MKRWLVIAVVVVLSACAAQQPVPELDLAQNLPDIAAQYVTRHVVIEPEHGHAEANHHDATTMNTVEWRIFRSADRIDVDNLSAHAGETWQRDGNSVFMRKLFHGDRKAIEYRMDDFAVLSMKPSWQKQALLIDAAVLSQLEQMDQRWIDGHPVRTYRGAINAQQVQIIWLVDINLPQSILRHDRHGELIEQTTLVSVQPLDNSRWTCRCGDDYEIIDYADLGDRERDQFVMRVQSQLPGGDVHRH